MSLVTELVLLTDLLPHERISEKKANQLLATISKDSVFYHPIIVDKKTKVILDGHHRFAIAKKLQITKIPTLLVDYFDDAVISVVPRRKAVPVSKALVIKAGTAGILFPYKSTKHILHLPYSPRSYSLTTLR